MCPMVRLLHRHLPRCPLCLIWLDQTRECSNFLRYLCKLVTPAFLSWSPVSEEAAEDKTEVQV
jgi:hypothetical protein